MPVSMVTTFSVRSHDIAWITFSFTTKTTKIKNEHILLARANVDYCIDRR